MKKLGFGLMRLPQDNGEIDLDTTCEMVDIFLSEGFDYFDTAYGYNAGRSEAAAKACIVDRYPRERFRLATKLPAWMGANNEDEAKKMFWTSLERTRAGYFDRYLLHNMGGERTRVFDDYKIWEFLHERKREGLIRELGFSFHDKADALESILAEHPEVDFVQLQINYADWESPVVESRKCYETAVRHNKPVIVMEPVKGGMLAEPPHGIAQLLRDHAPAASPSSWAVRFAASLDMVDTVLSGMSTVEQVRDNVSYMKDMRQIDNDERRVIQSAMEIFAALPMVPCTGCSYCEDGCPMGVKIPAIIGAYNMHVLTGNAEKARSAYGKRTENGGKATDCIACGACEGVCPQHIEIINALKAAADFFEQEA